MPRFYRKQAKINSQPRTKNTGITRKPFHSIRLCQEPWAQNEAAVEIQGEGVLADIARELVSVMRRDVRTDWTVRDDVRAKLRSSIKRLLVRFGYPPDKQPEAIKLVMEQMESMAPRFAAARA